MMSSEIEKAFEKLCFMDGREAEKEAEHLRDSFDLNYVEYLAKKRIASNSLKSKHADIVSAYMFDKIYDSGELIESYFDGTVKQRSKKDKGYTKWTRLPTMDVMALIRTEVKPHFDGSEITILWSNSFPSLVFSKLIILAFKKEVKNEVKKEKPAK